MRSSAAQAFRALTRYLAGWRLIALTSVVAGVFAVGLIASDGSVTTGLAGGLIALIILVGVVPLIALEANRIAAWSAKQSKVASLTTETARQVGLIDAVVAGTTRSWSDPTTLPWPTDDSTRPVLLLPGAAYHLAEIIPLATELETRGIPVRLAVGEAHWDRVRQGLVETTFPTYALPSPDIVATSVSGVVTMKDWAGYRPYVEAAQAHGIPTFAKVEGAQDFDEVDTHNDFRPYRTADHILCQGANDHDALVGSRYVVGSSRLERLWWAPLRESRQSLAIINLNFTYGVLIEERDTFLETAVEACVATSTPYVVSVHPAIRSPQKGPRFTTIPISRLLQNAGLLISRFSSVPFEAMARGIPFVYHNPHGELVPTFQSPEGAFRVTSTVGELSSAIAAARDWPVDYRQRSEKFFSAQVDLSDERTSEQRTADVIESVLTPHRTFRNP